MSKLKVRVFSIILALLMAFMSVNTWAFAEENSSSFDDGIRIDDTESEPNLGKKAYIVEPTTVTTTCADGNEGSVTWSIDENGYLEVVGTGDVAKEWRNESYIHQIKTAKVSLTNFKFASHMFEGCDNLTSVDFSNINTKSVIYMNNMFSGCSSLKYLDLSKFDTSSVEEMNNMFSGCSSLKSLDLTSFNTEEVRTFESMFDSCTNLRNVDLSSFVLNYYDDLDYMFRDCKNLLSVELTNNSVRKVDYHFPSLYGMFEGCTNLINLDLSGLALWSLNPYGYIFPGTEMIIPPKHESCDDMKLTDCVYLAKIKTPLSLNSICKIKLCDGEWLDEDGNKYENLPTDKSNITLTNKKMYIVPPTTVETTCADGSKGSVIWSINKSGKLKVDGTGDIIDIKYYSKGSRNGNGKVSFKYVAPWSDYVENIMGAEVCLSDFKNATNMFKSCKNLLSVDLSNLDTSQVTNMRGMFDGCSSLSALDLSNIDTTNVTDMEYMFYDCSKLSSIDISGFDMKNVTSCGEMLDSCEELEEIKAPIHLNTSYEFDSATWYLADGTVVTELPMNLEESVALTTEKPVISEDSTPENPTPVDPTPVDPTPVDPTPVDPTPVDPTPVDPTPVDPTPVDPTPEDVTPEEKTPDENIPEVEPTAVAGQKIDISDNFDLSTLTEGQEIAGYRIKDKNEKKIATVNNKGIVTPKKSGVVHIWAYIMSGKEKVDVSTIEVTVIVPTFDKNAMKANFAGQTVSGNIVLSDYDAAAKNQTVVWKSSKSSVATVDETTGLITALKSGKTTISVSFTNNDDKTVTKKALFTVKIPKLNVKDAIKLKNGKSKKLSVSNIEKTDAVTWTSSDDSVVSIAPNGKKAKIKALATGTAEITATVNGHNYKTTVTVY